MDDFKPVPFINLGAQYLSLKKEILEKFDELSTAGSYILGEEVTSFEREFAHYSDCKYAVGVANATDGLTLALKALDIGSGHEVITVSNSFIATAGSIIAAGAKPIFVDVGSDYNLNPELLTKAITKQTRAIIPVHLTGMPARMDEILQIAKKHNLYVIEDAAQAIGARYKGRKVGSFGIQGVFSLHPLKNLHLHGDGGAITTNDEGVYNKLKLLRNHGLINRDEAVCWGYNSRLDSIQAAIGRIKLKHIDAYNKRYRQIAAMYRDGLSGVVQAPDDTRETEGVYHNFVIMTDQRQALQEYMLNLGQETKIHYPIPIHLQKSAVSLGYKLGDLPVTEIQAKRILTMPIYPELTDQQVQSIIRLVRSFFKQ